MRPSSSFALLFVTVAVLVPGCGRNYPEGVYQCMPATVVTDCPTAWYCHADGRCWSRIEMADAAMSDAGTGVLPDGCVLATYYLDGDGDHHGVTSMTMQACSAPIGYADAGGDCDDTNGAIHPGASETCNGLDDDCSGMADDGGSLECVRGQATACTTTCGSTGTGLCSAACVRPTGASCAPPATETTCDGLDDNCNGVADEGLGSVGEVVTAIPNGGTPATQYGGARLVPSDAGYMLFAATPTLPPRLFRQALNSDGAPMGSPVPLDARIAPGLVPFSVLRVVGGYVLAYGSWSFGTGPTGPITFAHLDDVGAVRSFGALAPPSGYGAWERIVLVARGSIASRVSVYASMRTTDTAGTYALRRYSVDYASTTPVVLSETNIATDLSGDLFDATMGAPEEWVLYVSTASDALRLVRFDSVAATIGTIDNAAFGGAGVEIALGSEAPVSSANPLGIVWQDNSVASSPTTHFVEVSSITPLVLGASVGLPGGTSERPGPGNVVQIVPAPNGSVGTRSGHWFVAAGLHVWNVLGNGSTPTATSWTPPDAFEVETAVAIHAGGRIAYSSSSQDAVTRRIGCR